MTEKIYDLGIVGGGQLGMMSTQAARELNLTTIVLDPNGDQCSASLVAAAAALKGSLNDQEQLFALAAAARHLTVEIEHLGVRDLDEAANYYSRTLNPSAQTILNIQDKYRQHQMLSALNILVAPHFAVETAEDIREQLEAHPSGLIVKSRWNSYDGRGNAPVNSAADINRAIARLQNGDPNKLLYVEHRIPYIKELAMMAAKGVNGEIELYPLVETSHLRGQLKSVLAPADVSNFARLRAINVVNRVAESFFKGAGVVGVEMFLGEDDQILVNEVAPRTHNSGHFTIEACETSQFMNHVLTVTGQPPESTAMVYPFAGMVNIIGDDTGMSEVSRLPSIAIHDYQKSPRPERKLGHVTLFGYDYTEFMHRMNLVSTLLTR